MANDLLGVSVSGLRRAQAALSTVGHNIANADTEGYSRQRVETSANPANLHNGSYIGNGVQVENVNRIVNRFVTEQLRTDKTLFQDLDSFYTQVGQLDTLLSNDATGLSSALNQFSAALQNGANDPTSIPARQLIISEAESLAGRFNSIHARLDHIGAGVTDHMEVAVEKINVLASNIAQLNVKITNALGVSTSAAPNDLYDQRDRALQELSGLIPIQVFDQGSGQVNVAVGSGQSLVLGQEARQIKLEGSAQDPSKAAVFFKGRGQVEDITSSIKGGELGGLIRFRDEALHGVYNALGTIAVVTADSFNRLNSQGINLDGQFGERFFYDINEADIAAERVVANSGNANAGDQLLSLNVRDSSKISGSDYRLQINGGGVYQVTRISDGEQVSSGLMPARLPFNIEFDGLELELQKGSFQAGDSFLLKPVASGASDFATSIINPADIAFASPLLTDASLGNRGSGQISAGDVTTLVDANGDPLPLFAVAGAMAPPLLVSFTSPHTYDILDNSDPGNPVHLSPPIRSQRYVPGANNLLFATDPGVTQVSSGGDMIGLPDGRQAVTQAALIAATAAPDFSQSDFSASNNRFSFDLVVSGRNGNNGTHTITINGGALVDENALLTHINAQLGTTGATAYLDDAGGLAFRLDQMGHGNITLQNFNDDPDGNGDPVAAGLANGLLGIDIENFTHTTVGNADGVSGQGILSNGYPTEVLTITRAPATPGLKPVTTRITTDMNASARQLASDLAKVAGVEAQAYNYMEVSDLQLSQSSPLQIQLNGVDLLPGSGGGAPGGSVPDPISQETEFYNFLASQINANQTLRATGVHAIAAVDPISGANELRISNSNGEDFTLALTASAGDSLTVSDGEHAPLSLAGAGNGVQAAAVVGGRLDVSLGDGLSLSSLPPESMLFGNTAAEGFALGAFMGIQATLSGSPQAGDTFTLDFNGDAAMDNRNALKFAELFNTKTVAGLGSFAQAYSNIVELVGIETHSAKANLDAAEQVLVQSQNLRDSISGVNLDEEAADLIRFEQLFSANAQVISVARDIFDRLISSF